MYIYGFRLQGPKVHIYNINVNKRRELYLGTQFILMKPKSTNMHQGSKWPTAFNMHFMKIFQGS